MIRTKYKKTIVKNYLTRILYKKYLSDLNSEKIIEEKTFFDNQKYILDTKYNNNLDLSIGETINSPRSVKWIYSKKPDLLVVMGTSLIKKELISCPHIGTINMHTGLSPYYRGGMTNLWPIINKEPQFCGVTIHQLSEKIDGGEILYTSRPTINEDDNFSKINSKSIIIGTELMIKSIDEILTKCMVDGINQWTKGYLYHNRHFNAYVAKKYFANLKNGVVKDYAKTSKDNTKYVNQPRLITVNI